MKKTALVIDDDPLALELYVSYLECAGHCVVAHDDPQMAIREFERQGIDTALVDMVLPGITGCEVIRRCSKIQKSCRFIVISGYIGVAEYICLKKLGVYDCFTKPVDMATIIQAVNKNESQSRNRPSSYLPTSHETLLANC